MLVEKRDKVNLSGGKEWKNGSQIVGWERKKGSDGQQTVLFACLAGKECGKVHKTIQRWKEGRRKGSLGKEAR